LSYSEKLLSNPGALCNMVRRIALGAGAVTLEYFDGIPQQVEEKHDGSPVTLADHAAEEYIRKGLLELTADVPIIAEEAASKASPPDFDAKEYFWLVDPLDATREFIAGGENYTVNIGLLKDGIPVLGVVYAPALGVLYAAHGETAIRWSEDTNKDKEIRVRRAPHAGLTVLSSQYHSDDAKMDKFLQQFKVEKILKKPSSLKLCMLAEGRADIYPRLAPTSEWDTAAGEAILRAAGGVLTDMNGKRLEYGCAKRNFVNPEFVAASFEWYATED
jgi:3'(2'), 5'-bisphosphate nucleotidase